MSPPLISIIIPVFNAGESLGRALDSVLSQSFSEWEAICVDDGSTDGSGALLDAYAEKSHKIKVIHKKNGGVASARNCGLEYAHAPYITMLDADDYFNPFALEKLYLCMSSSNCDLVCCTMNKLFSDGNCEAEKSRFCAGSHIATPADIYRFAMRSPCCKLYNRDIIERGNIRFPQGVPVCEDDVFVVSYWYHVRRFYMLNEPLYNYIQSETSVLKKLGEGSLPLEGYLRTLDVPILIYRYIKSQGVSDEKKRVWASLLFKSQCHIGIWMQECNKNTCNKLLLERKNRDNKKELCCDVPVIVSVCVDIYVRLARLVWRLRA